MTFEQAVDKALEFLREHKNDAVWDSEVDLDKTWYLDTWVDHAVRYCVLLRRDNPFWQLDLTDQL